MKTPKKISVAKSALAVLTLCVASPYALAADGKLSVGTGFDYSSGTYGTSKTTDTTSIPLLMKYEVNAWTLKLTVPYIIVSGGTGVIPGLGTTRSTNPKGRGKSGGGGSPATTASAEGLGDVVASATYAAYTTPQADFGVDLTGKVKFGTADQDKGLGSGENDYSVQVDVFKSLDRVTLFGGVGYTVLGSSQYVSLDHGVFNATVGGSYKLSDLTSAGVSFDARQSVSSTASQVREMTAFVSHKLGKQWKAQAYVLKGFADGSPDWGAGATINYAF